jgi:hypothetical protein
MTKNVMIGLLVLSGFVVTGCPKKDDAGGGGGDSVGVAECDDYIKKYEACMSKVPAAGKPAMEQAFKTQRDSFKASAATPEGKTALKASCKTLVDSLATNPMCK